MIITIIHDVDSYKRLVEIVISRIEKIQIYTNVYNAKNPEKRIELTLDTKEAFKQFFGDDQRNRHMSRDFLDIRDTIVDRHDITDEICRDAWYQYQVREVMRS